MGMNRNQRLRALEADQADQQTDIGADDVGIVLRSFTNGEKRLAVGSEIPHEELMQMRNRKSLLGKFIALRRGPLPGEQTDNSDVWT